MNDLTRRRFLTHSSIGVALAGALAVVPGLATVFRLPARDLASGPSGTAEPLIAHVRDLASGEILLLVGTEQVVQRDRELAARLYAAARQQP